MRNLRIILACLCLAPLAPFCPTRAQEQRQAASGAAQLLDEYRYGAGSGVRVGNDCDVDAHLDNFAYYLRAEAGSRGYMIFYRGKRKPPSYFAFDPEWQHGELVSEWKLAAGQVVLVDGGYREEAGMELWIVPAGARPPSPRPTFFPQKRRKRLSGGNRPAASAKIMRP